MKPTPIDLEGVEAATERARKMNVSYTDLQNIVDCVPALVAAVRERDKEIERLRSVIRELAVAADNSMNFPQDMLDIRDALTEALR